MDGGCEIQEHGLINIQYKKWLVSSVTYPRQQSRVQRLSLKAPAVRVDTGNSPGDNSDPRPPKRLRYRRCCHQSCAGQEVVGTREVSSKCGSIGDCKSVSLDSLECNKEVD